MDRLNDWMIDAVTVFGTLPAFVPPVAAILLSILAGQLLHWLAFRFLTRVIGGKSGLVDALLHHARRPLRLAFVLIALITTLSAVTLPGGWEGPLRRLVTVLLIVLIGWTILLLTNLYSERSVLRYRFDTDDNLAARKYVTQVRVLRRVIDIVVVILTAGAVLLTFESVRQYGVSLFASAGAAGLVLGFAARPVLANLIAGVQIALTQPIRLEDVVIVEGEWGWVEEISATYVVVRIWDWRRMVVPLSYFIEQPFQNWTRETASIIGAVTWHLDYTVPVAQVRTKLEELVKASTYWDGNVVNLQVTEAESTTLTLRGLMSARTSSLAWDLRCEIREKLIAWLQAEYPQALPRMRIEATEQGRGPDRNR
ncbi:MULTISPECIES: mechanosensitive ion channel family protein [unclassified Yoonia]|uniref:mechanosensitive ion channel family protein n=1 Tax=unclassified Yoonia TaxID=2629118 RepID=UPI002B000B00|nr:MULTISPECIES: mechanosensitive ion channel family protein [unclassified Yoonia]